MIGQKAAAKEHRWELQGDQEAALNAAMGGEYQGGSQMSPSDNRLRYNRGGANKQMSKNHNVNSVVTIDTNLKPGVQP